VSRHANSRQVFPLVNFVCRSNETNVANQIVLRGISDYEWQHIFQTPGAAADPDVIHACTHALVIDYEAERTAVKEPADQAAIDSANRYVTALHLHHEGDVLAPVSFGHPLPIPLNGPWTLRGRMSYKPMFLTTNYFFQSADVAPVATLNAQLGSQTCLNEKRLQLAISRFESGFERHTAEDLLLDSFIGLETCLIGDNTSELSYRLSLRGAALLANSRAPECTRAELLAGYFARSKIVHEGLNLRSIQSLKPFMKQAQAYRTTCGEDLSATSLPQRAQAILRDTIREILSRIPSRKMKGVESDIDLQIARALKTGAEHNEIDE
jgi:hypothetical protein